MTALLVQFTCVLEKSDKVITKPNGFFILAPGQKPRVDFANRLNRATIYQSP